MRNMFIFFNMKGFSYFTNTELITTMRKKGIYRDNASQRQTKVNILQICKEIDNSVNRKQFQVFAENEAIYQVYNYHKQTAHYQSIKRNKSKSTNRKQLIVKAEFF